MRSSGGVLITSWKLGPSFYLRPRSLHGWFWLQSQGAICFLGTWVSSLLPLWDKQLDFLRESPGGQEASQEGYIHSRATVQSFLSLIPFWHLLVTFLAQFFCSSPAFWVVLLRSSHIRALSHGSPTWWQATSHQLSCQIFIMLDTLKITAVISYFSTI